MKQAKSSFKRGREKAFVSHTRGFELGFEEGFERDIFEAVGMVKSSFRRGHAKSDYRSGQAKAVINP